jgi:hypothetical protein
MMGPKNTRAKVCQKYETPPRAYDEFRFEVPHPFESRLRPRTLPIRSNTRCHWHLLWLDGSHRNENPTISAVSR